MSNEPETPDAGKRLDRLKRRVYVAALTIAGVAAMLGYTLQSQAEIPYWAQVLFGPVIAALAIVVTLGMNLREIPMRTMERAGFVLAVAFLLMRCTVVFFLTPQDLPLSLVLPDFSPWMASVFIFSFVALRTSVALPAVLVLYVVLIALAVAYALWYGTDRLTRADVNLLVQEFVVSNAFTITMLYFLSRTKEELTRERTVRALMMKLAHTDELTGLANRRFILQSLQRAIDRSARDQSKVAVVMFDLDRFKAINDTYGHPVGDEVLRRTAELARERLRTSDELGRYGGEEFLIVAFGADLDAAAHLAERLRVGFEQDDRPDQPRFTASFGVATHRPGEPITAVLARADGALYAAKSRGRNRVVRDVDVGKPLSEPSTPEQPGSALPSSSD